jgi:hypothetical protein
MKAPESADPLSLGLLTEFDNCQLLATESFRKLRECKDLDELMALHDIVLLDAAALGELLEIHEGETGESRDVHPERYESCPWTPAIRFHEVFGFFWVYRQ